MSEAVTTIIIADDHPILLKGLKDFLQDLGLHVLATASDGKQLLDLVVKMKPDFVLMDLEMPEMTGLEVGEKMNELGLPTKKILLTLHKELFILQKAKELQFSGYILKEFALEELTAAIGMIKRGEQFFSDKIWENDRKKPLKELSEPLTPSETKILRLIADGLSSKEIADKLFISERTVDKHRSNVISKLNLEKKHNSLLLWAQRNRDIIG
ncbi:response regulator transcription factor [Algoriphagus confluentis]|uniref:Response regulator transcription factor n=1 Tax=Algoriphagus confluentis TaxID=1697556 RepID=A0ABQ6PNY2_9BACT|nr:response regulator transcription factor [Algoriphagus confluentis]